MVRMIQMDTNKTPCALCLCGARRQAAEGWVRPGTGLTRLRRGRRGRQASCGAALYFIDTNPSMIRICEYLRMGTPRAPPPGFFVGASGGVAPPGRPLFFLFDLYFNL